MHPEIDRPASELYLGANERPDLLGSDGLPQVHLVEQRYAGHVIWRFCDDVTGKLMTAEARSIGRVGLWAGKARGLSHYQPAARRADLSPGRRLILVPQPDNPHDPHAIAIAAGDIGEVIGFVNRAKARQLGKALAPGAQIECVSMEGTRSGASCAAVTYVAAAPHLIAHILGPRPAWAARPAHWA